MRTDYIDESGKVVAWIEDNRLFKADGALLGSIDFNGNVVSPETGETLVFVAHEGLFNGSNQLQIARLKDSEFNR